MAAFLPSKSVAYEAQYHPLSVAEDYTTAVPCPYTTMGTDASQLAFQIRVLDPWRF